MDTQEYKIRSTRKKRKMTGVEVAKMLNISPQYYYDIEKGKKNLSADKLIQLAKIFNVQLEELIGEWDEQIHPEFEGNLGKQLKFDRAVYEDAMGDPGYDVYKKEQLSPKEERDIAADLERMIGELESNEAMAFHGEPMDDETKELMKISLENSLRLAKGMAKQKFNPHKNK